MRLRDEIAEMREDRNRGDEIERIETEKETAK